MKTSSVLGDTATWWSIPMIIEHSCLGEPPSLIYGEGGSKYNVKRRMKSLTIIDYNLKTGTPQLQLSDPVI